MKKTLLTLIKGEQLKISPGTKVIDADTLGTLMEAHQALEKIQQEAEQYQKKVVKECEGIKKKAYEEGFLKGQQEWVNHIQQLENQMKSVRQEVEALVIPLALKAAKKIVGREIELNRKTIVDIISNNLKAVSSHKKIIIYVNKSDYDLVDKEKDQLKKIFEGLESLSIQERHDIAPQGCMIETEAGIINAQIENQWRVLEKAFAAFAPVTQEEEHDNPAD